MNIIKTTENKTLNIAPEGRLDTTTAPQLEAELRQSIYGQRKADFRFREARVHILGGTARAAGGTKSDEQAG